MGTTDWYVQINFRNFKRLLICTTCTFLFSACSIDANLLKGLSQTSDEPKVLNIKPDILDSDNMNQFPVTGDCPENGKDVTISGDVSGTAPCTNGTYSYVADLSPLFSGGASVTIEVAQTNHQGNIQLAQTILTAESDATVTVSEYEQRVSESNATYFFTVMLSSARSRDTKIYYLLTGDSVYMLDTNLAPAGYVVVPAGATTAKVSFSVLDNNVNQAERLLQFNIYKTERKSISVGAHSQSRFFIKDNDGGVSPLVQKVFPVGTEIFCATWTDTTYGPDTLHCAGGPFSYPMQVVDGSSHYLKLATMAQGNGSSDSFCALTVDGKVKVNNGTTTMTELPSTKAFVDVDCEFPIVAVTAAGGASSSEIWSWNANTSAWQVFDNSAAYVKAAIDYYGQVCALTTANKIKCMTVNGAGVLTGGPYDIDSATNYIAIESSGEGDFYGLTDLGAWIKICTSNGCNTSQQLDAGPVTGVFGKCAVKNDGTTLCDSYSGSMGNLSEPFAFIATTGSGGNYQRACGVKSNGDVKCWGIYSSGSGFNGLDFLASKAQKAVKELNNVIDIFGSSPLCARTSDGKVSCWNGAVDGGPVRSTPFYSQFFSEATNVQEYYGGNYWSEGYMTTDGKLHTRFSNDVDPTTSYKKIDGDPTTFCGLTSTNQIRCLRYGTFTDFSVGPYKDVAGNLDGGCAIDTNNKLSCWDRYYNLMTNPGAMDNSVNFKSVSGDYLAGCGILDNGELRCWSNDHNWAGNPTTLLNIDSGVTYKSVTTFRDWIYLAYCGITTTNQVRCGSQNSVMAVADTATYTKILRNSCGVTTDGHVRCWKGIQDYGFVSWGLPLLMNKWLSQ